MRRLGAVVSFAGAVLAASVCGIGALPTATSAWAQDCAGNPQAIGTSRILAIDPIEYPRVGLMQYRETLPLSDKEVVLTFDDGPLPRYSDKVLDILAAQCVRATYFLIGRMAHDYPEAARRIYAAGHTIGTHTEDHPLHIHKLPIEKVRQEIDEGIASVTAALGDAKELAPFFRIPGLFRTDAIDSEIAARALVVFSSDVVADDWYRHIKPGEIVRRAITRLEARGKGILLLHDIHPVTVEALPELLKELKEHGFRIVHVVPAAAGRIETAGAPSMISPSIPSAGYRRIPSWWAMLVDRVNGVGLAPGAKPQWPDQRGGALPSSAAELPVPSMQDIGVALEGAGFVGETVERRASLTAGAEVTGSTPSRN